MSIWKTVTALNLVGLMVVGIVLMNIVVNGIRTESRRDMRNINMCFLFHKWPKWSDVKTETWHNARWNNDYTREYQERTCEKCGKYEKRYIYGN